jgi:hypothetical protein
MAIQCDTLPRDYDGEMVFPVSGPASVAILIDLYFVAQS